MKKKPKNEHCPTCGEPTETIFDHVAGCLQDERWTYPQFYMLDSMTARCRKKASFIKEERAMLNRLIARGLLVESPSAATSFLPGIVKATKDTNGPDIHRTKEGRELHKMAAAKVRVDTWLADTDGVLMEAQMRVKRLLTYLIDEPGYDEAYTAASVAQVRLHDTVAAFKRANKKHGRRYKRP